MDRKLLRAEDVQELENAIVFAPDAIAGKLCLSEAKNVAGAVFPGVIYDGKTYEDRVVAIELDEFIVYRGKEVLKEKDAKTLLTIVDGWSEEAEKLLEEVYFKLGNRVVYLGGGAGSLKGRMDCLFINGEFFRDDVVFVALPERFDVAVRHGWQPTEHAFVATRTDGRRIIELDWKPAFGAYSEVLHEIGVEISRDNFFDVAKAYPFGMAKVKGEDVVRDPLMVEGNDIICAGRVANNAYLRLMRGDKRSLVEAAKECVEAVGKTDVVFDCISRVLYLEEDFAREAANFRGACGALTIGEVACKRGFLDFYNKTVVVGYAEE
ncbi:FIST signal transduction protein [Archaeoglobus sp.]